ncbi:MAG: pilus assembly PilX N-terminal domain-containing protein [Candidatus Vogelbacteria bacterium]|nr:pilus assembly PilX N-terminal domain-containing protein [Candidatus Vogelbacteria bacterium]
MSFSKSYNLKAKGSSSGQAVIGSVIFLVLLSVVIIAGFATPLARQLKSARASFVSRQSYFAAESGIEDAAYRLKNKLTYSSPYILTVATAEATVGITEIVNDRQIEAAGNDDNHQRKVSVRFNLSEVGVDLLYGVQVSDGGLEMKNGATVEGNVYSNGSILGSDSGSGGPKITGDVIVAGGINENPSFEWANHDSDQFFATVSGNRDVAQSFTANASDKLNRVSVYLAKVGNPADLTLQITEDDNGKPKNSALASAALPASGVGANGSWINVSFASPPNLTNGAKYWIVLDADADSSSNHWNWRKDNTDGYVGNTGRYTSKWNTGGASWTNAGGDLAFRVWLGGVSTKIEGVRIGNVNDTDGDGYANVFNDVKIRGLDCPNEYCHIDNPARAELPISDGLIQDWRDAAFAGGVCAEPTCDSSGNLTLGTNDTLTLGPIKIPGNLIMNSGAKLTLNGTIWVGGVMNLSCGNNGLINLAPGYGAASGVLLGDDSVTISNNCKFDGSGAAGSYIILLSAKNAPADEVMNIDNNSAGVIYYAGKGRIKFSNNATAKEATAYGIILDNNAVITYEEGIGSALFSSGPGGGFEITSWREVE